MGTLGIVMAIMMLVTNLFVILVVRLTMVSNFDYKAGMYLGVHIPADKKEDAEVTSVVNKTKKQFNVFNNVNMGLSVAICGICVVDMIIFVLYFSILQEKYTICYTCSRIVSALSERVLPCCSQTALQIPLF